MNQVLNQKDIPQPPRNCFLTHSNPNGPWRCISKECMAWGEIEESCRLLSLYIVEHPGIVERIEEILKEKYKKIQG
jgi:hypothetical protein